MSSDLYPNIDQAAFTRIKLISQMVEDDPTWLDHPDCPYSESIKDFFRARVAKTKASLEQVREIEGELDLEAETEQLYRSLRSFGADLKEGDPKEFLAWMKLSVTVTDKLLSLTERTFNVRRQKAFEAAVFAALEVLSPTERTAFRDKLEAAIE